MAFIQKYNTQYQNINIASNYFENVEKFKYN